MPACPTLRAAMGRGHIAIRHARDRRSGCPAQSVPVGRGRIEGGNKVASKRADRQGQGCDVQAGRSCTSWWQAGIRGGQAGRCGPQCDDRGPGRRSRQPPSGRQMKSRICRPDRCRMARDGWASRHVAGALRRSVDRPSRLVRRGRGSKWVATGAVARNAACVLHGGRQAVPKARARVMSGSVPGGQWSRSRGIRPRGRIGRLPKAAAGACPGALRCRPRTRCVVRLPAVRQHSCGGATGSRPSAGPAAAGPTFVAPAPG
ncbi:hypothetical protein IP91_04120 [Pseudoduganella lurida]|uniref:Uncharacterized protein n=1 Tax=Pseudoduganella lurida TaxID=1036180 RepID=A0A562R0K6_9BURK|nr:hypothetical protein IP91_04120 [Pseudoduganella lurida]